jgi:hypothetical protein
LETELELDSHCDLEHVQQLVGLYQQAIEYYEYVKDHKYLEFNKRLHRLLTRPDVRSVLVANAPKPRQRMGRKTVTGATLTQSYSEANLLREGAREVELLPVVSREACDASQARLKRTVTRIIDSTAFRAKDTTQKVKDHIATQEVGLQRRLEERRQRQLSKAKEAEDALSLACKDNSTAKATPSSVLQESDKCGGIPLETLIVADSIERLMEESYAEQEQAKAKVRGRYQSQISEFETQQATAHNDLIQLVIDQMKATMEEEVKQEVARIKQQRHEEIRRLRL